MGFPHNVTQTVTSVENICNWVNSRSNMFQLEDHLDLAYFGRETEPPRLLIKNMCSLKKNTSCIPNPADCFQDCSWICPPLLKFQQTPESQRAALPKQSIICRCQWRLQAGFPFINNLGCTHSFREKSAFTKRHDGFDMEIFRKAFINESLTHAFLFTLTHLNLLQSMLPLRNGC